MDAKTERKARTAANNDLGKLANYHDGLPIQAFDNILTKHGFEPLENAIYCGREGQCHQQVGTKTFFHFTWYKMESGKYEIVAYLS